MVSSHLSVLNEKYKSFGSQLLLPDDPPNAILTDDDEFDFSDVFGPLPGQFPVEVNEGNLEIETNNIVYDNSAVVYRRSHSLVGPSACLSQSLKLGKLNLQETEEANVILECVNGVTIEGLSEISTDEDVTPLHPLQDDMLTKEPKVGLEDFEIMRLVGQGAFGKVYQVCKKGTSEIYAMKVMRKDKIMEKNHAEYMKAERDILTKIDHPFIVQLRYSFQVITFFFFLIYCKLKCCSDVGSIVGLFYDYFYLASPSLDCSQNIDSILCWIL